MITVGGAVLLAVLVDELHAVVRPDAITQVIKQFDDGEGLFRRPVGRNVEGDSERQRVRDFADDLALRRWCARCSARSWASLRR